MGCGSSNASSTSDQDHQQNQRSDNSKENINNSNTEKNNRVKELPHVVFEQSKVVTQGGYGAQMEKCDDKTKTVSKSRELTILHFNDVYNIESREKEPVGGAARFAKKVASYRHLNPLIVFSGDCLNPSSSECKIIVALCILLVMIFSNADQLRNFLTVWFGSSFFSPPTGSVITFSVTMDD